MESNRIPRTGVGPMREGWLVLCLSFWKVPVFNFAKLTRRFRRIVTSNIRKLLQYAILLVFRFFVFLYHSTRLPYRLAWFATLARCFRIMQWRFFRFSARRFEQIEINRECKDTDRNSPCRLKEWTICSASCSFVHSCRYRQIGRSLFVVFVSVTLQMYKKL